MLLLYQIFEVGRFFVSAVQMLMHDAVQGSAVRSSLQRPKLFPYNRLVVVSAKLPFRDRRSIPDIYLRGNQSQISPGLDLWFRWNPREWIRTGAIRNWPKMDITGTPSWLASPRLTDKEEGWFLSEMGFQPMTDGPCPLRTLLGMAQFNLFPLLSRGSRLGIRSRMAQPRTRTDRQRPILIIYTAVRFGRWSDQRSERTPLAAIQPIHPSSIIFQPGSSNRVQAGFARGVPRCGCKVTYGRCPLWNISAQAKWPHREIVSSTLRFYIRIMLVSLFLVVTSMEKSISLASLSFFYNR